MKTLILISSLLVSLLSFGQIPKGGQRICGKEFAAYGAANMTYSQALDMAGQMHNDYQDYLLNELNVLKPDFTDTIALKRIVSAKSTAFFSARGLQYDENFHSLDLAKPVTLELGLKENSFSREGYTLIQQFQQQLKAYNISDAAFITNLNGLKEQALNLSDGKEAFSVGVPISIAIHSYAYWQSNGQKWMDLFANQINTVNTTKGGPSARALGFEYIQKPVNLWHLGGADAAGAIRGAMAGGLAGGVLVSAVASLGNLVNQVLSSLISWWPF